jgi:RND family efflux transporter MFP subunit
MSKVGSELRQGLLVVGGATVLGLGGLVIDVHAQGATAAPAPQAASTAAPPAAAPVEPSWLHKQWLALKSLVMPGPEKVAVAPGAPGGPPKGPPPQVIVSQPLVKTTAEWDEYTARFDATEAVEVRARISGYLTEVHFKDGQMVKKGDLLFTIDPRPFERALDLARAELAQAKTRVENTSKDVERGRPLLDRRILSEKTFDDRENLKRDAEASVKVAEARVKTAELDLSFTRMNAPMSGRIGRAVYSPGNWVSAGGANNSTILTSIVAQDPLHIYFDVSENNYLKYKRLGQAGATAGGVALGGDVEIALPDERGFPHKGKLDFADNRLDPGTSTLRARAVIDNKAGLFSPGMFGRVRIAGSQPRPTVLLPDEAIGTDQSNKFVFVVAGGDKAERRVIEVGPLVDGLRVVRNGLKETDWVIVRGVQRARPGQPVTPKREPLKVSSAGGPAADPRPN